MTKSVVTKKVVVYMPVKVRDVIDTHVLKAQIASGKSVSRSALMIAIIESADLTKVVATLAGGSR